MATLTRYSNNPTQAIEDNGAYRPTVKANPRVNPDDAYQQEMMRNVTTNRTSNADQVAQLQNSYSTKQAQQAATPSGTGAIVAQTASAAPATTAAVRTAPATTTAGGGLRPQYQAANDSAFDDFAKAVSANPAASNVRVPVNRVQNDQLNGTAPPSAVTTPTVANPSTSTATVAPVASTAPTATTATATPAAAAEVSSRSSSTTNTASNGYTPAGLYLQDNLDRYNADREAQIRALYDAAQQNALNGLRTAYDQNLSDAEAARDRISPQYQSSMNALSAEYERQRRNNNMQAAVNGLNTGAGSQMALAQSASYQANQAGLAQKENDALNEANRRIADLQQTYQNAVAEATANNNYKLAAALLDEYQNAYNRQMNLENTNYQRTMQADQQNYSRSTEEAARRAQYGDFSGYADLYGEDIAKNMERTWALQNPQIAYAAGKLSAEDYEALTGRSPSGVSSGGTSGSMSSGSYGKPSISVSADGSSYTSDRYFNPQTGEWDRTPSGRTHYLRRIPQGRGYSASRDRAYRGAPGYLNENGRFVTGWSDDAPASGHEQDYAVAHAYADAYNESNNRYLSNLYAQDTYQDYAPTKTWSERATGK